MIKARSLVLLSYILAFVVAWATLLLTAGYHLLIQVLIADIAATVVVFLFSWLFNNSSFYDPYWSVIPIVIAGYFMAQPGDAEPWRQLMVLTIIGLWGIRLTANWLYTWRGLDHVDWRYVNLQAQAGVFWWPLSFAGVHLMPTVIVFMGCIPMYSALVGGDLPLNWIDLVAFGVGAASIWLEFQADRELHHFRETRTRHEQVLDTGLWRLCRHPNYLGEIGVWVSIFLFGFGSVGYMDNWMAAGPVVMFLLFALVSIPMLESKLARDKPDYAEYKRRTFALIPLSGIRR